MGSMSLAEALLSGKPYFGPELRANQGGPERHKYFLPVASCIARQRANSDLQILEIGSWAGASVVTWVLALRETGLPGKVTCVDPWRPYFDTNKERGRHYWEMNAAARSGLIFRLFEHNLRTTGVAGCVEVCRGDSREILPGFADGSFDIIYIDGSHRFEDVLYDIQQSKRLLRSDGVVCGDDLEIAPNSVSEEELGQAVAAGSDFVYSETAGKSYHPGVTAAVAKEFGMVSQWSGFWAAQRFRDGWTHPALDLSALRPPEHIQTSRGTQRIVGSTATHNLIDASGQFFAVAKSIGPIDLFEDRLIGLDLPPVLLRGSSLEEVRTRAECLSSPAPAEPRLMDTYDGYNLVAYRGRMFALDQAIGDIDLSAGVTDLEQRFGASKVFSTDTTDVLRTRIDNVRMIQRLAALESENAALKGAIEAQTEMCKSVIAAGEDQFPHAEDMETSGYAETEQCAPISQEPCELDCDSGEMERVLPESPAPSSR